MTQVAADGLGVDLANMRFEFGDTDLPNAGSPGRLQRRDDDQLRRAQRGHRPARPAHRAGRRRQPVPAARRRPGARSSSPSGRMTLAGDGGTGETYGEPDAAALHERRRGHRQLGPAAAGHPARAADLRRPVRPGRGGRRPRPDPGPAPGRRVRPRPGAQPEDRPQPAHGRHALGPEPGAARGHPHGHHARPLGQRQPGRLPGARQRRRARRRRRADRGRRTTSSTRSGSRASARSGRSAWPPPSPTRCTTRPATGSASCRSRSSTCWRPAARGRGRRGRAWPRPSQRRHDRPGTEPLPAAPAGQQRRAEPLPGPAAADHPAAAAAPRVRRA